MSVERQFLAKGGKALAERVLKFMGTLVVKIDREAALYETKASFADWSTYKQAFEHYDNPYTYEYTESDLLSAGYSSHEISFFRLMRKEDAFARFQSGDSRMRHVVETCRSRYLANHIETNRYYMQFQGEPLDESQELYVKNLDYPTYGNRTERLKDIDDIELYPKTYKYYFLEGHIADVQADNPEYVYRKFITNPLR